MIDDVILAQVVYYQLMSDTGDLSRQNRMTRMRCDFSFFRHMKNQNKHIASDVRVHDADLNAAGTIDSCSGVRILRPKRGPGSALSKAENRIRYTRFSWGVTF